MNFIIYSLPRSRSYWLSRFLNYGDWRCGHDELRFLRSLDDVESWFKQRCVGTCETAAAPFWRLAKHLKTVTIRRPVEDVFSSLMRLNLPFDPERLRRTLQHLDRKLDQIEARVPDVLSVRFDDLAREDVCAKIFQHCLPYPHDPAWWSVLDQMNLQINLGHMLDYFRAYEPQLTKLAKIAKHTMLVQMNQSVTSNDDDGLTIQEETLATSFADAMKLFQEHAIAVGEAPDAVMNKNLNLIATLEANGALQIMTARCNGRMFGYLMSVIAPSLERSDLSTALQTLFFASPLIKGVGMRLQRESVKALIAKGVKQIDFHAGVRGSGPRLGTLYRRLGAAEYGQMYRLSL